MLQYSMFAPWITDQEQALLCITPRAGYGNPQSPLVGLSYLIVPRNRIYVIIFNSFQDIDQGHRRSGAPDLSPLALLLQIVGAQRNHRHF